MVMGRYPHVLAKISLVLTLRIHLLWLSMIRSVAGPGEAQRSHFRGEECCWDLVVLWSGRGEGISCGV